MRVDLDRVECRSAFDIAHGRPIVLSTGTQAATASTIRLIELSEVLFLPDALEAGQSVCLAGLTFVPTESVLDGHVIEFFKQRRQAIPRDQRRYLDDFEIDRFEGPVCILGNLFSRNFGHWTEELLKVAILEQSGASCDYVIATLPSFALESLELLGIDQSRIKQVTRPTVFARALFSTAVSHENLASYPQALAALRDMMDSAVGCGATGFGTRLWLERDQGVRHGGVVTNRDEVRRCTERFGFEVVDMATLSLGDQIRGIRQATAVAGPHGSQFVLTQFMPPSSIVVECFSPIHVNPSILQICRALGHSYHQIVSRSHVLSPYSRGRDCEVDCEHLSLVLEAVLG